MAQGAGARPAQGLPGDVRGGEAGGGVKTIRRIKVPTGDILIVRGPLASEKTFLKLARGRAKVKG